MEDFSRYLGINRTSTLICCIFYIFLQAETDGMEAGNSISRTTGSTVTLNCCNDSNSKFTQLTWKRNGVSLFTFRSDGTSNSSQVTQKISCVRSPAAESLNLNVSTLENQLYALIIKRAQKLHMGNYTCEISTVIGVVEQKWELIITEEVEAGNPYKIHIAAAVIVPCMCFLIFIIVALIILKGVCKRRSGNLTQSPTTISEQREDIYENCLELEARQRQRRSQIQDQPYKYNQQL